MNIRQVVLASVVGLTMVGASAASAQVGEGVLFPACDGAAFPCVAIGIFSADTTATDRAAIVARTGAINRFDLGIVDGTALLIPNARALSNLADDPELIELYPDRVVSIEHHREGHDGGPGGGGDDTTSGGSQTLPSGVARIGAAPTDNLGVTGAGVNVAIVDTGVDFGHVDLRNTLNDNIGDAFFDYRSLECTDHDCGDGQDDHGHGTHVAGIVAALNNDQDVVGVAPDATVHAVKVLNSDGYGLDSWIIAGLDWVLENGTIDVVNMSLGAKLSQLDPSEYTNATCDFSVYGPAFTALEAAGIVVAVSAGNDRNDDVENRAPAGCSKVITVAATNAEDGILRSSCGVAEDTATWFTTDGDGVAISAPGAKKEDWRSCGSGKGTGILSLALGGGTARMSGTSMSAPHVAGVAALLIHQIPYVSGGSQTPAEYVAEITDAITNGAYNEYNGPTNEDNPNGESLPLDHPVFGDIGDNDNTREGILCAPGALGLSGTC